MSKIVVDCWREKLQAITTAWARTVLYQSEFVSSTMSVWRSTGTLALALAAAVCSPAHAVSPAVTARSSLR